MSRQVIIKIVPGWADWFACQCMKFNLFQGGLLTCHWSSIFLFTLSLRTLLPQMSDEQLLQRLQNQALEDRQEPERRDSIESQDSDAVSFFFFN